MYGGRLSDPEVVRTSGLIDELASKGFAHGGIKIMADRGFNPLALDLAGSGLQVVAPPTINRRAKLRASSSFWKGMRGSPWVRRICVFTLNELLER